MLDFDDNWDDHDFAVVQPVQVQPVQMQQQPIQPVGSIGSTSKAHQQFQAQTTEPQQQPAQAELSSNNFFQDEWDPTAQAADSWAQNPMQTFPSQGIGFQQPAQVKAETKDRCDQKWRDEVDQKHEEEVVPAQIPEVVETQMAEVVEPAKQNRGVALNSSAKVNTWGNQSASSFAQPMKKKKARKQKQTQRKPPTVVQVPPTAVVQEVATTSSQQSFVDQATVQELMNQVASLTARVNQLEQQKREALLEVCTLNSSGEINQDGYIFWNSNHILKPREQRYQLSDDLTRLVVKNRALYQITFNSSGENPMLVVDGDVYASTHTNGKSSNSVNLFLYLAEGAEISGAVSSCGTKNACEHWLCVRLIPSLST